VDTVEGVPGENKQKALKTAVFRALFLFVLSKNISANGSSKIAEPYTKHNTLEFCLWLTDFFDSLTGLRIFSIP
jgi:hypothetical protein